MGNALVAFSKKNTDLANSLDNLVAADEDITSIPGSVLMARATNWGQVRLLMLMWLKGGMLSDNMWYGAGTVMDDTAPLLPVLTEIHRYGFMTLDGQPGVCEVQEIKEGPSAGKWGESKQRAYMNGFFYKSLSKQLAQKLNAEYGLWVRISDPDGASEILDPKTETKGLYITEGPKAGRISLTEEKVVDQKSALRSTAWTYPYTSMDAKRTERLTRSTDIDGFDLMRSHNAKTYAWAKEKLHMMYMVDPQWCRQNYLSQSLLSALKSVFAQNSGHDVYLHEGPAIDWYQARVKRQQQGPPPSKDAKPESKKQKDDDSDGDDAKEPPLKKRRTV
jgi:hypothetical protein